MYHCNNISLKLHTLGKCLHRAWGWLNTAARVAVIVDFNEQFCSTVSIFMGKIYNILN